MAAVATHLGIDEAGRGSLLGPLVVGAYLVRSDRLEEIVAAGAQDSKALTPARRVATLRRLQALGRCTTIALTPTQVDRAVLGGALNRLEAEAFARLIRMLRPTRAFVDACDPVAARFGRTVAGLAGGTVPVDSRHHADRDVPVVGAASIVAKVARDRAIARLSRRLATDVGSGYPSDPATVRFAREALNRPGPRLPWLRQSWRTTERLIAERQARTLDSWT